MAKDRSSGSISGGRKAAILITLLGEDIASAVFKHLPERDIQAITQELATLGPVSLDNAKQIIEEYHQLELTQEYLAAGGMDYATRILVKSFGDEGARHLLAKVSRAQELSASKVESLQRADPQQLAKFLEAEHPQTVALILGHLETKQASILLMKLPDEIRAEVVKRLAHLRQFSPEMAEKVSIILNRRLLSLGEHSRMTYSGFKSVADLMNRLDTTAAQSILEEIEREEPNLAISIRNLMFTFEDFLEVPDVSLRELMGHVDRKALTLALKGASEELRDRFFRTMSTRAIEMLKEDMEMLGPVRSRDVAKAQQETIAVARKLESEGKIVLKAEGDDEYVV
jgi:flagellar motor switch protein FliG